MRLADQLPFSPDSGIQLSNPGARDADTPRSARVVQVTLELQGRDPDFSDGHWYADEIEARAEVDVEAERVVWVGGSIRRATPGGPSLQSEPLTVEQLNAELDGKLFGYDLDALDKASGREGTTTMGSNTNDVTEIQDKTWAEAVERLEAEGEALERVVMFLRAQPPETSDTWQSAANAVSRQGLLLRQSPFAPVAESAAPFERAVEILRSDGAVR